MTRQRSRLHLIFLTPYSFFPLLFSPILSVLAKGMGDVSFRGVLWGDDHVGYMLHSDAKIECEDAFGMDIPAAVVFYLHIPVQRLSLDCSFFLCSFCPGYLVLYHFLSQRPHSSSNGILLLSCWLSESDPTMRWSNVYPTLSCRWWCFVIRADDRHGCALSQSLTAESLASSSHKGQTLANDFITEAHVQVKSWHHSSHTLPLLTSIIIAHSFADDRTSRLINNRKLKK